MSNVVIALKQILANKGQAGFDGASLTLQGDFGDSFETRLNRINQVNMTNVVGLFKDDIYSSKIAPLLYEHFNNETNPNKIIELDNDNDGTIDETRPPDTSGVIGVVEDGVTNTPPLISPLIPAIVTDSLTEVSVDLSGHKFDFEDSSDQLIFSFVNNQSSLFTSTFNY